MQEYVHSPVLLDEVLEALRPRSGGRYIDGTVGGGGHAAAILEASSPNGWLFGCDRDGAAITAATKRLARFSGRFECRQASFAEVDQWLEAGSCDGAVLDLGVSSFELEQPERGFSFQADGPLDMRMDQRQSLTAAQLISDWGVKELARIFRDLGGERKAFGLARIIDSERRIRPIQTTQQLAQLIERHRPRRGRRVHPATHVFLALRMVVNDELGVLERGLEVVWTRLKNGARLSVITFHSAEAQVVKEFGRSMALPYTVAGDVDIPALRQERRPELRIITRKPIRPGPAELAANPRSRSAQLRVFEKINGS